MRNGDDFASLGNMDREIISGIILGRREAHMESSTTAAKTAKAPKTQKGAKESIRDAFLGCLDSMPYEKINVSIICSKAGVSRKAFYYHFMDKNDLVKWICFQDIQVFSQSSCPDGPSAFTEMVKFFLERNRMLYGHALQDMSTGSFGQFFTDMEYALINHRLRKFFPEDQKCQKIAQWAITLEAEKARMLAIVFLLDPDQHSVDDLEDYLFVSERVISQVVTRWTRKVEGLPRYKQFGISDFTADEYARNMTHDFTLESLLGKGAQNGEPYITANPTLRKSGSRSTASSGDIAAIRRFLSVFGCNRDMRAKCQGLHMRDL